MATCISSDKEPDVLPTLIQTWLLVLAWCILSRGGSKSMEASYSLSYCATVLPRQLLAGLSRSKHP